MAKVALPLALVALALAAWTAVEVNGLKDEVHEMKASAPLAPSGAVSRPPREDASPPPVRIEEPAAAPAAPGTAPALVGAATEPAVLAQRLAALEERVKTQEAGITSLRERDRGRASVPLPAGRFIADVDTAARELKLDDRQRTALEEVVEASRRELERLHTTPNDEGTTWREANRIHVDGGGDGEGVIAIALGNSQKAEKFKKTKVPGTNETFGEADARIRRRAKDDARRLLTPEQQKTWDDAMTDPLFGGGGGFFSSVVVSAGKD